MDAIRKKLIEFGVAPSIQRIKIFEFLMKNRVHPTVDMIYRGIKEEIPTLSRTTVYNTLSTFVEHGLAVPLYTDENETLYDMADNPHSHFKCVRCGRLYDLDIDERVSGCLNLKDFKVQEVHLYFKGICPECIREELKK